MRLNRIEIRNFMQVPEFSADLSPLTLIAGNNETGKSSIRDAIDFALTGSPGRASIKKNLHKLVRRGESKGSVMLCVDGGEIIQRDVGSAVVSGQEPRHGEALQYVLRGSDFARKLDQKGRRKFLYELMGIATGPEEAKKRLLKRGIDAALIDRVITYLAGGFEPALQEAERRRVEHKAQWREVTGETYGDRKAEGWICQAPEFNEPDLLSAVNDYDGWLKEVERLNQLVGRLDSLKADRERVPQLRETGKMFARASQTVKELETLIAGYRAQLDELDEAVTPPSDPARQAAMGQQPTSRRAPAQAASQTSLAHPMNCPKCSAKLIVQRGTLVIAPEPKQEPAPAPLNEPVERELKLQPTSDDPNKERRAELNRLISAAETSIEEARKLVRDADAAIRRADEIEGSAIPAELAGAPQKLAEAREELALAQADADRLKDAQKANKEATDKTKRAGQLHAEAMRWDALAQALGPNGVPAEILEDALGPLRKLLQEASEASGWHLVEVSPTMEITADGFEYELLSKSVQWRVDAMLAVAIAQLSGLKVVVLDEMDILQPSDRPNCLRWLYELTKAEKIDSAVVMATLLQIPPVPADVNTYWIGKENPE